MPLLAFLFFFCLFCLPLVTRTSHAYKISGGGRRWNERGEHIFMLGWFYKRIWSSQSFAWSLDNDRQPLESAPANDRWYTTTTNFWKLLLMLYIGYVCYLLPICRATWQRRSPTDGTPRYGGGLASHYSRCSSEQLPTTNARRFPSAQVGATTA